MDGFGSGELVWVIVAALLALGVVMTWIIKAESSRKIFRAEVNRLKTQLDELEREKMVMVEEVEAFKDSFGTSGATGGAETANLAKRIGELEKENQKLKNELDEAKSSLEEVYKALCSK